jgi:steroid delta-isomerase-like uncharacterized protein
MRRRTFLAGATLAAAPCLAAKADPADEARALAERFATTLSAHDIDAFAALLADDYINHQMSAAAPPLAPGKTHKQASVDLFKARLAGIPDLKVSIEAMVPSAQMLAASFVYEGTHGGLYYGAPPTGKKLRFTSCDIFRIANGKLAEHWGMGDIAGVLAQLKS